MGTKPYLAIIKEHESISFNLTPLELGDLVSCLGDLVSCLAELLPVGQNWAGESFILGCG